MVKLSGWGLLNSDEQEIHPFTAPSQTKQRGIAFGLGRSYGDCALNPSGLVWLTSYLNKLIAFDQTTGILTAEAGVSIKEIQDLFVPQGWALPVTPGTEFITIGGAIANDVHGKSHHMDGSFSDHVTELTLVRTDGQTIVCSETENPDWFWASVGGIGLTGMITSAQLQLRKIPGPWLASETLTFGNIDEFFEISRESQTWENSVSWIDCVGTSGRGLFMRGNRSANVGKVKKIGNGPSIPFTPPLSLVNGLSLRIFNSLYFRMNSMKPSQSLQHYKSYFYPLDGIHNWNRMYGPRGFYQYQSLIPPENASEATKEMLKEISRSGEGSFLAVLKSFGERSSRGLLGFPGPGVTLALDFPNRGESTAKLFTQLDSIVRGAQGKLYLAKDARMTQTFFAATYPRIEEFLKFRDPGISSSMSQRLLGS